MDVFLAQDEARERTGGLISLLVMLLGGALLVLHLLGVLVARGSLASIDDHWRVLPWSLPLAGTLIAGGVIARIYALRNGGAAIAEELGGHRIHPATRDPFEARLIALVEELAVGLGTPVPETWVLPNEESINAFMCGNDPAKAVIGVTRGAMERLNRDELRAVLAHEFSHLVCGEMRLNFNLLAWVQGILFLTLVGRGMIRASLESDGVKPRRGGRRQTPVSEGTNSGGDTLPILGIVLVVLGSISSIFGRILQGAICRDRESAADAAAVEMTQNSPALLRAFKKMGGMPNGSLLMNPNASLVGHLFFGQAAVGVFSMFFPTHPPVEERILQMEPDWGGEWIKATPVQVAADEVAFAPSAGIALGRPLVYRSAVLEQIGMSAGPAHFHQGAAMVRSLKPEWRKLTQSKDGVRKLALEVFKTRTASELELGGATPMQALLLLDLAMPLLRRMTPSDFVSLMRMCRKEVHRGDEIDVMRFMLAHVLARRLAIALGMKEPQPVGYEEFSSVWEDARVLISLMANVGSPTQSARLLAYSNAWAALGFNVELIPDLLEEVNLALIVSALDSFEQATPKIRRQLMVALGIAAVYDNQIEERQMVLLRLVADAIGSPIPLPLSVPTT